MTQLERLDDHWLNPQYHVSKRKRFSVKQQLYFHLAMQTFHSHSAILAYVSGFQ